MKNYFMIADKLYEIKGPKLIKSQDTITSINKLYYRDPLLAKTRMTLVFYRKFNKPRVISFRYYDIYYDDMLRYIERINVDDYDDREYIIRDILADVYGSDTHNSVKHTFTIQTDIDEAILLSYVGEEYSKRDIVLLPVYMDKNSVWDSLVVMYPFGNLYNNKNCCWGTEENGTIHSLGEWFDLPHNNDLIPDTEGVDLYDYLDNIIMDIAEDDSYALKCGVLEYILNDINKRLTNTFNLFKDVKSAHDSGIIDKIKKTYSSKDLLPVSSLKRFIRF